MNDEECMGGTCVSRREQMPSGKVEEPCSVMLYVDFQVVCALLRRSEARSEGRLGGVAGPGSF